MLIYEPRVLERELPQAGVAIGRRVVASLEVHLQQDVLPVGHGGAEDLRPLGRLPVGDARVVEACDDEKPRVGRALRSKRSEV